MTLNPTASQTSGSFVSSKTGESWLGHTTAENPVFTPVLSWGNIRRLESLCNQLLTSSLPAEPRKDDSSSLYLVHLLEMLLISSHQWQQLLPAQQLKFHFLLHLHHHKHKCGHVGTLSPSSVSLEGERWYYWPHQNHQSPMLNSQTQPK